MLLTFGICVVGDAVGVGVDTVLGVSFCRCCYVSLLVIVFVVVIPAVVIWCSLVFLVDGVWLLVCVDMGNFYRHCCCCRYWKFVDAFFVAMVLYTSSLLLLLSSLFVACCCFFFMVL